MNKNFTWCLFSRHVPLTQRGQGLHLAAVELAAKLPEGIWRFRWLDRPLWPMEEEGVRAWRRMSKSGAFKNFLGVVSAQKLLRLTSNSSESSEGSVKNIPIIYIHLTISFNIFVNKLKIDIFLWYILCLCSWRFNLRIILMFLITRNIITHYCDWNTKNLNQSNAFYRTLILIILFSPHVNTSMILIF